MTTSKVWGGDLVSIAQDEFQDLIRRIRRGDADAAAQLVRQYEPDLRLLARVRLNDPRLRRVVDSMDVCQSILANFFIRAASGQFDLDSPDQLLKLLTSMVRNKVTDYARRQRSQRRDVRKRVDDDIHELDVFDEQETPSQIVARAELVQEAHEKFSDDERQILERRTNGQGWDEIAAEFGASPEAVRKKLTRAVDRVAQQLGLDTVTDA